MKKNVLALLLAGILTLSGCSLGELTALLQQKAPEDSTLTIYEETMDISAPQTPLVTTEPEILLWAREQLAPGVQETYDRLNTAVACHQESPVDVDATMTELELALTALRIDHPEYFWFAGEAAYVTTTSLFGESMSCELTYTMTASEAEAYLTQVESYAALCLSSPEVAAAETDFDKILAVYRYIINNTDYVVSETDQNLLSVMTTGIGTCAGYSRTFQYLMHRLNIPCTMALGYGDDGEAHGWNVVLCGGQWYHIDVTWGDPVDEWDNPGTSLDYTYCMLTDEEIFRTHTVDDMIPLPECVATEFNYYRYTGRLMSAWDALRYESLLRTAMGSGEMWFSVRFDSQETFDAAWHALIDNSGIITVFSNCGLAIPEDGITYSYDNTSYEFSVKIF